MACMAFKRAASNGLNCLTTNNENLIMKLSLIALLVLIYTVMTVAWICYTQTNAS